MVKKNTKELAYSICNDLKDENLTLSEIVTVATKIINLAIEDSKKKIFTEDSHSAGSKKSATTRVPSGAKDRRSVPRHAPESRPAVSITGHETIIVGNDAAVFDISANGICCEISKDIEFLEEIDSIVDLEFSLKSDTIVIRAIVRWTYENHVGFEVEKDSLEIYKDFLASLGFLNL